MIEVLNLGAGVQSSTVLLMSLHGELPKLDYAIFADTGWEPAAVYRQFDWLKERAEAAGITVYQVSMNGQSIRDNALKGRVGDQGRFASMPYFALGPDGARGQIKRECTYEYKVEPIAKCIRYDILGLKPRQRSPKEVVCRCWFGISFDERTRMKEPYRKYETNWYPLVERRMTRTGCLNWIDAHGYHEPPRSACIGCPYRNNRQWRRMKTKSPEEWEDAVAFDRVIRHCGRPEYEMFIHSQRKPLDECNLWRDQDENQLPLFDMVDECSGMCGV